VQAKLCSAPHASSPASFAFRPQELSGIARRPEQRDLQYDQWSYWCPKVDYIPQVPSFFSKPHLIKQLSLTVAAIRDARISDGLTQAKAAQAVQVSLRAWQRGEARGRTAPLGLFERFMFKTWERSLGRSIASAPPACQRISGREYKTCHGLPQTFPNTGTRKH